MKTLQQTSAGDIVRLTARPTAMLTAYRVQRVATTQTALLPVTYVNGAWRVSSLERGLSLKVLSTRECFPVD